MSRGHCSVLFNHLICEQNEVIRDGQAEHPRGLKVDHKVILCGGLYGQLCSLLTFEDAVSVRCSLLIKYQSVYAVRNEPSGWRFVQEGTLRGRGSKQKEMPQIFISGEAEFSHEPSHQSCSHLTSYTVPHPLHSHLCWRVWWRGASPHVSWAFCEVDCRPRVSMMRYMPRCSLSGVQPGPCGAPCAARPSRLRCGATPARSRSRRAC